MGPFFGWLWSSCWCQGEDDSPGIVHEEEGYEQLANADRETSDIEPIEVCYQSKKAANDLLIRICTRLYGLDENAARESLKRVCDVDQLIQHLKIRQPDMYAEYHLVFSALLGDLIKSQERLQIKHAEEIIMKARKEALFAEIKKMDCRAPYSILSTLLKKATVVPSRQPLALVDLAPLSPKEEELTCESSTPASANTPRFTSMEKELLQMGFKSPPLTGLYAKKKRRVSWDPELGNKGLVSNKPNSPAKLKSGCVN